MKDAGDFNELIAELSRVEDALAPESWEAKALQEVRDALLGAAGVVRAERLERVVAALLPDGVPSPAGVWHARETAELRASVLREFGALTAGELADRARSGARNRSALAFNWRAAGRVFAVEWHGRTVFPAFQLTADGQPLPVVAPILAVLRELALSDWQIATWFVTPTGWLEDRRPADVLGENDAAVLQAARSFGERAS
jgi:hypothetical protein